MPLKDHARPRSPRLQGDDAARHHAAVQGAGRRRPARLPIWSELSLGQLAPGRYVLRLTATDLTTNRTASARVGFYVE